MAPLSSPLAWKLPWTEEPGGLQSMGSLGVGHDWATSLSLLTFMHWRRKWQPLQCSCLENPRDGGAWWAAVYGVAQGRTRLKWLSSSSGGMPLYQWEKGRLRDVAVIYRIFFCKVFPSVWSVSAFLPPPISSFFLSSLSFPCLHLSFPFTFPLLPLFPLPLSPFPFLPSFPSSFLLLFFLF